MREFLEIFLLVCCGSELASRTIFFGGHFFCAVARVRVNISLFNLANLVRLCR